MTGVPATRAEVNVTPLVDVALVLLVIFIVVTPMMRAAHPVELPPTAPALPPVPTKGAVVVRLEAGERLFLGEERLASLAELPSRLAAARTATRSERVFVSIDDAVPYDAAMVLLDVIQKSGAGGRRVPIGLVVER